MRGMLRELRSLVLSGHQQATYLFGHEMLRLALVGVHRSAELLKPNVETGRPTEKTLRAVRRRYRSLLKRDLQNAKNGIYPWSLLSWHQFHGHLLALPRLLWEMPRMARRARRKDFKDLPSNVDLGSYPKYFQRTFHWQTDGYLSDRSARLYDVGVELLFLGCADVMRRQALVPLLQFARQAGEGTRVLDLGCGTGGFLQQLHHSQPGLSLWGVDLSSFYVRYAQRRLDAQHRLSRQPSIHFKTMDATATDFADASFDAVSSIFVLHEMPRSMRRKLIQEALRVLRPGGLLIVMDSVQRCDSPQLAELTDVFAEMMHEPFYQDYAEDPLTDWLPSLGVEQISESVHLFAKCVVGVKNRDDSRKTLPRPATDCLNRCDIRTGGARPSATGQ